MAKLSKEAVERARKVWTDTAASAGPVIVIARALQEVMEDRDAADGCSRLLRDRAEKAEASKAQLIREVREWWSGASQGRGLLEFILAKHEDRHG